MKIAYVLDDTLDKPDGVQQYILTVGEYMRSQGHDIHYVVAETKRTDIQNIHSMSGFWSLKFNKNNVRLARPISHKKIVELNDLLKDFDVIHIQMPFNPLVSGRVLKKLTTSYSHFLRPSLGKKSKLKVVGTYHTFAASRFEKFTHSVLAIALKSLLSKFDATISVSSATKVQLDAIYGTDSVVVPNAVDIARFRVTSHESRVTSELTASKMNNVSEHETRDSRLETDRKRIVFLGRFVERKGVGHLVRIIAEMRSQGYDFNDTEVIMAGKGPDFEKTVELAQKIGVSDIISFPGFLDESDKPALLQSANIAIFPSTKGEAFGIVLIEAMAAGAGIVLGGNNPGYASVFEAVSEALFDPTDHYMAAGLLISLLDNIVQSSGLHTKQQVLVTQFDVSKVGAMLLSIYEFKN